MPLSDQLAGLTAHDARELLDRKEISSVELTRAHLERIRGVDGRVKAFVTVSDEFALEQACRADERIDSGDARPLTGIPMQLKDNMATKGIPTTCSSRMLQDFVPPYNATVTQRLYAEGAVLLGKGNLDEFAMGSSTENSALFTTRNPWDTERVPGGSSGGPAAAVAADECVYALGSDTGGSIRQPAALCGVVGFKPTYGLVSRYGLVAFASSLDQIGPITKDVTDCAIVMNAIAGHDFRDSTSIEYDPPDYTRSLDRDLSGFRLGAPKEYFVRGMEPGVEEATREAIRTLEGLGATVEETSLPHTSYALAVYYIIAPSEASANLARYDGVKYGYSAQGRRQHVGRPGEDTAVGLRTRSEAAHNAGNIRPIRRLLRCLLPEGAEGSHDHKAGIRGSLRAVRRTGHANVTIRCVQDRREDRRPRPDVSQRHSDHAGQHRRDSRNLRSGRDVGRAAGRLPDNGQTAGRRDHTARRIRL